MRAGWMLLSLLCANLPASADEAARVVDAVSERVPLHTVAPKYPKKARRDRIEGEVQVCFDVDRQGRTRRIAVRNSTHRAFEKPSMRAVRASTFRPLEDSEPLPAIKVCRTFIFALEQQSSATRRAEDRITPGPHTPPIS